MFICSLFSQATIALYQVLEKMIIFEQIFQIDVLVEQVVHAYLLGDLGVLSLDRLIL